MNSREIVTSSLDHQQPSRVAVDLGSTPSSGISAIAYNHLKQHLGFGHLKTRIYDVVQQLAEPDPEILDALGVDVVDAGRTFNEDPDKWYPVTLADGSEGFYPKWFNPVQLEDGSFDAKGPSGELLARMPSKGTFFDQACFPYVDGWPEDFGGLDEAMGKVLWAAFVHSPWDHAGEAGFWDKLAANTRKLRQESDRAIVVVCGCNLFEWGTFLRRMDQFLMDLITEQDQVEALLDALLERHLATLEKVCQAVGDTADVIRLGDDLGMDSGPFMPPDIYKKLFKPRHTKLCEYIKANSNMKILLHSCGSIYALIPDLIEAGIEILNPVQTICRDMEPARLKQEFGKDVVFWGGGCDTRSVMRQGTVTEVRDHVRENLDIFAPDGGFVFNPVHNILPEVPPENVVAAFEAVKEYSK